MYLPKLQEYSSVYTRLASSLLFPVHERLKKHTTVKVRNKLEKTQWLSNEELKALQIQRLSKLLQHAQQHVPYYRDLFAQLNLDCCNIHSLDVLAQIPFLDKTIIRENYHQLMSDLPAGLAKFNTGGSSG